MANRNVKILLALFAIGIFFSLKDISDKKRSPKAQPRPAATTSLCNQFTGQELKTIADGCPVAIRAVSLAMREGTDTYTLEMGEMNAKCQQLKREGCIRCYGHVDRDFRCVATATQPPTD